MQCSDTPTPQSCGFCAWQLYCLSSTDEVISCLQQPESPNGTQNTQLKHDHAYKQLTHFHTQVQYNKVFIQWSDIDRHERNLNLHAVWIYSATLIVVYIPRGEHCNWTHTETLRFSKLLSFGCFFFKIKPYRNKIRLQEWTNQYKQISYPVYSLFFNHRSSSEKQIEQSVKEKKNIPYWF